MEKLKRALPAFLRFFGFSMLIVGIVAASCHKTPIGLIPVVWFMLALCAFIGANSVSLFRMAARQGKET